MQCGLNNRKITVQHWIRRAPLTTWHRCPSVGLFSMPCEISPRVLICTSYILHHSVGSVGSSTSWLLLPFCACGSAQCTVRYATSTHGNMRYVLIDFVYYIYRVEYINIYIYICIHRCTLLRMTLSTILYLICICALSKTLWHPCIGEVLHREQTRRITTYIYIYM